MTASEIAPVGRQIFGVIVLELAPWSSRSDRHKTGMAAVSR